MSAKQIDRLMEILLVEDNPGDVRLVAEALKDTKVTGHLSVVPDGIAALDFLHRRGPHVRAPRPDLILLDLNLPRMSGHDLLKAIKEDPALRQIPVCVLTSSQADSDLLKAYDLHANAYLTKPADID